MIKSTRKPGQRKPSDGKPKKPHATYPLTPHASGKWMKKIQGHLTTLEIEHAE